ncbi:raffinose/stachyose/melibiose transport system permease protein [Rhizobium sp. BK226]|jgi:raffinose/stachyose/melibiose transport system permease protein|uniref:Sugar ABC transporter permease n=1 Tax=Rhizobium anhuiense TaxID=1184720 RepID=A0A3S0QI76_9HYPH|nr:MULTISPECIES: sugar ABC transporter permease [Rhizobium]MBB4112653.1 raffinose/stachyose/melibiose transport system permease protein [Rhizobium sp. BK226]NKM56128.1 ABC transporter permease subunit [Rhizobium anhuiense]PDS59821.1 ABC transporter [Rhizobium anhuiense]RUM04325.1 sugar ABC transporter permease [Rhizobium anhuiense]UTS88079.1 sugar ABC transporter permease [Rhizobium anhuiense bv. trifolii]
MTETRRRSRKSPYPLWFFIPAAVIYGVLFLFPTISSLWFSLTRWDLSTAEFIGLENFRQFFSEPFLVKGLVNTLIYAVTTSGLKTVCGLLLAVLLTSNIFARGFLRTLVFFPVLVSTIGIGITFTVMMHPTKGIINVTLETLGIPGPGWLTNPALALFSVALVDVWKGVGLATLIFIAGLAAISPDYYEAARIDGATRLQQFSRITLPLVRPATVIVVTLSLIGGLRSFDLIWAMTRGGPGFSSDVIASVIYKQYQAGFYGLSTAGNVILFALIAAIILPFTLWFNRREVGE